MKPLHSKKQDELEARDQGIFLRVVIFAGIALIVLLLLCLLLARFALPHMRPQHSVSSVEPVARAGRIDS